MHKRSRPGAESERITMRQSQRGAFRNAVRSACRARAGPTLSSAFASVIKRQASGRHFDSKHSACWRLYHKMRKKFLEREEVEYFLDARQQIELAGAVAEPLQVHTELVHQAQ